jgi:hypothetical protein
VTLWYIAISLAAVCVVFWASTIRWLRAHPAWGLTPMQLELASTPCLRYYATAELPGVGWVMDEHGKVIVTSRG